MIYDKYVCTPYLQTLQFCTVVSKTAAGEQKLGLCPEIPYCPEVLSHTLPQLATASKPGTSYKVVLQYQHDEWPSIMNSGLLNTDMPVMFNQWAGGCTARNATVYDCY